jgi:Adenylate kinase
MKVSLLGLVGSGKGTQAHLVLGKLDYTRISTGDLVRGQLEADTELGRELKGYSDQGEPGRAGPGRNDHGAGAAPPAARGGLDSRRLSAHHRADPHAG